ncbi:hypothetical protein C8J56DRAFT_25137 [Mycena floridula]|nr:hypothetical protein C8J56DRAFT_25137 [Mycena floridula]
MATVTFNGRKYPVAEFLTEIISLADGLAQKLKLDSLGSGRDYAADEMKEIHEHLQGILLQSKQDIFWSAFIARHLAKLATTLKTLSLSKQRNAFSVVVQIFSWLPDPKENPYFRRFLASSAFTDAPALPTLIASAFTKVDYLVAEGQERIATLLIHFLFWCDTGLGDDKNGSIDAEVRSALAADLRRCFAPPAARNKKMELRRLEGILSKAMAMPGPPGYYIQSTREYLEGQVDICPGEGGLCGEETTLQCSSCKVYRYCSKECQTSHWKKHRLMCFKAIAD